MTGVTALGASRRDARALRFLLLLLGCWILVRVMAHWTPGLPPPTAMPRAPWEREAAPAPWVAAETRDLASGPASSPDAIRRPRGDVPDARFGLGPADASKASAPAGGDWDGSGRHKLRFALMARMLPPPGGRVFGAFPTGATNWMTAPDQARGAAPGAGRPYWMQRQLAGWSLGAWVYGRSGSGTAPEGIAAAGQLGGSQAGVRLVYGFGDTGRTRAYGRATLALGDPRQRELALGVAFAPVARLPIDLAVEQRFAAGRHGRTALAVLVGGGVGDVALPGRFRLEAYGQAGVVGARHRDPFADAAVAVDREIARVPQAGLHLGAFAAGAAQPGAARLDVGPRLTVRLPDVGEGSRVAVDWRQRVAGDARPDDGLAVTLAADF